MNLNSRVGRLEQRFPPHAMRHPDCPACAGYAMRTAVVDMQGNLLDETRPAACPVCGWRGYGPVNNIVIELPESLPWAG